MDSVSVPVQVRALMSRRGRLRRGHCAPDANLPGRVRGFHGGGSTQFGAASVISRRVAISSPSLSAECW